MRWVLTGSCENIDYLWDNISRVWMLVGLGCVTGYYILCLYWELNLKMVIKIELQISWQSEYQYDWFCKISIDYLFRCQSSNGGFGGGPGQYPHLAPTYAAVNALVILGTDMAFKVINR